MLMVFYSLQPKIWDKGEGKWIDSRWGYVGIYKKRKGVRARMSIKYMRERLREKVTMRRMG